MIVAGYQGVSYKREVTTLGRGGSDTTAVALAAALDAEACEIYSDVAGVYTADPRVVPEARRLSEISYEEMQELAEAGARVLNAQAVEFAKERGIAIYARATSGDGGETVVRRHAPRAPGRVVGVASETGLVLLRLAGGDLEALLGAARAARRAPGGGKAAPLRRSPRRVARPLAREHPRLRRAARRASRLTSPASRSAREWAPSPPSGRASTRASTTCATRCGACARAPATILGLATSELPHQPPARGRGGPRARCGELHGMVEGG